ncbi:MAG TPA: heat-inducible transcriptional repressor HrcA [Actinomycetota bacterium]
MLDSRKAAILRAIVHEYVRTGQPVGSRVLADQYALGVSPATVRNDMSLLEELGYIQQPHTSAGRVPTDHGYRWFVDNWPGPTWPDLAPRERAALDAMWRTKFRELEELLDSTSQLLSDVTEATAVVSAPTSQRDGLRRLELLARDGRRATLLLIADTGNVEHAVVELSRTRTEEELSELARSLTQRLAGMSFEELPAAIRTPVPAPAPASSRQTPKPGGGYDPKPGKGDDGDLDRIATEIERMLAQRARERIFRGGTAKILAPDKFSDLSVAHQVVEALEYPPNLSSLFAAVQAGEILVFIGREVPVEQMQSCAVVFASYGAGGNRRGALGVVGPTRMDYPHTISAVEAVARSLSRMFDSVA